MRTIRIGAGAGYAGDRLEPALDLMEKGNLDYIMFECLAERTISIAQQQKLKDPTKGYNNLLEHRMVKVLPLSKKNNVKVITNMGAANPISAAKKIKEIAQNLGVTGLKIAAVIGDDVTSKIENYLDLPTIETGEKLSTIRDSIVSANAYIGAEGIVEALRNGADVVVTGRVADPALAIAPLIYEFGWSFEDYSLLGAGTVVGHLLECGAQVSGGYFADPGYKDVPELWNVGFPIAEVNENGEVIIEKLLDAGGVVSKDTIKEQILYEIHDPANYLTPNVICDITELTIEEIGKDRVLVKGAKGKEKTGLFKTSIGYKDCYIGEGEMSYGGSGAYERAKLAGEVVKKRLELIKAPIQELRIDYIGVNSLYKETLGSQIDPKELNEVRLRVAGRTEKREDAVLIGNEVEALYTNGPAGGGGARSGVKEIVSILSVLIPSEDVTIEVIYEEV
ncbi:acyclic terpene utilization AtuA family protein [Brevibacillus daliensis]|uniref:acyclic terpene utilization AtuA family protein n=1 Tax=Brevibacillus daliensis TaxID=2892995 RepID=UPI001E52074C|nr:acyclic terpene utilization AtuA family protein [Brevibacillus daliensis]